MKAEFETNLISRYQDEPPSVLQEENRELVLIYTYFSFSLYNMDDVEDVV